MRKLVFVFCLAALAVGCGGPMVEVKQDWDGNADFSKYKTFAWVPSEDRVSNEAQEFSAAQQQLDVDGPMRAAIEKNLLAKGFTKVEKDPDMLVAYQFGSKKTTYTRNWGMHYWENTTWYQQQTLTDGTLTVDLVDAKSQRMVWRGLGWGPVNKDPNQEIVTRNINRAVEKILDQYPPQGDTQQQY